MTYFQGNWAELLECDSWCVCDSIDLHRSLQIGHFFQGKCNWRGVTSESKLSVFGPLDLDTDTYLIEISKIQIGLFSFLSLKVGDLDN